MKHTLVLLLLLLPVSCARKVAVRAPEVIHADRYSYVKDAAGVVYIITVNTKDLDEAMKKIHPGPSSVDKLDLWVVTPLTKKPR